MLGPCFAANYLVFFLVMQLSAWGRGESWVIYFNCIFDVIWLLLLCVSSSRAIVGLQCVIVVYSGHTDLSLHKLFLDGLMSSFGNNLQPDYFQANKTTVRYSCLDKQNNYVLVLQSTLVNSNS